MNSKKVLLGLTVLATPFVVENLVETNVASANQAVATQKQATKSSEYVLNKPAKAYLTANDAAQRVNQKATYKAGTYQVYSQSKGMVNISRATGKPGSWINPIDNPNAKVATTTAVTKTESTKTPTQAAQTTTSKDASNKGTKLSITPPKSGQYSILKSTEAYVNAVDASKKVNAKGTVSPGNYYIYREHKGMLNVSRAQGKVGSWINPTSTIVADLGKTTPTTKPETKQETTKPTAPTTGGTTKTQTVGTKTGAGVFSLTSATEAYVNAADASKKVNARGKVAAGSYHIFREYKGMLNISKAQGKPGSWINPGVSTTTEVKPTAPTKTETKQETTKTPAPKTDGTTKTQTVGTKTGAGVFLLTSATEAYVNAVDASKKVNARGKVAAGSYHIFREYKGMLNISKAQGKPGSWINPGASAATEVKPTAPTKTETKQETTKTPAPKTDGTTKTVGTKTSAGVFSLTSATETYVNAVDASKKVNARGKVSAGNYYIYREYKGMLNISKAQGKVGSWINPNLGSVQSTIPGAPDASKLNDSNSLSITATNIGGYRSPEYKATRTSEIISKYQNYLLTKYAAKNYKVTKNTTNSINFDNGTNFIISFNEYGVVGNRITETVTLKTTNGKVVEVLF